MNKTKWALALTLGAIVGAGGMLAVHQRYKENLKVALDLVQEKAHALAETLGQSVHGDQPKVEEE